MFLIYGFQLFLALVALWLFGLLTQFALETRFPGKKLWFNVPGPEGSLGAGSFVFHPVLLAQIALVAYVYLRSLASHLAGDALPVTTPELVALPLLLIAYLRAKGRLPALASAHRAHRRTIAFSLLFCLFVFCLIAHRELPRLIMLSTDPDQHAFWASQVARFGGVPFHQHAWGIEDFNYPAGFAVMNFLWMKLSGLDVRNVVASQILVQMLLAMMLLLECLWSAPGLAAESREKPWARPAATALLLVCYWLLFPYGYLRWGYFQEGAARQGSSFLLAGSLSYLYMAFAWSRSRAELKATWMPALLFAWPALLAATAFLFNPINLILNTALAGLGLAVFLWRAVDLRVLLRGLPGMLAGLFFLLDPYYLKRFSGGGAAQRKSLTSEHEQPALDLAALAKGYLNQLWQKLTHPDLLLWDVKFDFWSAPVFHWTLLVVIVLLVALRFRRKLDAAVFKTVASSLAAMLVTLTILTGLFQQLAGVSDFFLLHSYFQRSVELGLVLWFGLAVASITSHLLLQPIRRRALLLAAFVPILFGMHYFTRMSRAVDYGPRRDFCGSGPCPTKDDLAVIARIQDHYRKYREEHPGGSEDQTPRILVPNSPISQGSEEWLFPVTSTRVLPYYDLYPLAFYYFQGEPYYTVGNYKDHVCNRLDREWLLAHRIRYVFVPSDLSGYCVSGLKEMFESKSVIFSQGSAYFISLEG